MIKQLLIKNLAIIQELEVTFNPGLNMITGETGSGKSILIDAIGLLAGGRATGDIIRTGEDTAVVEGELVSGEAPPGGSRQRSLAHFRKRRARQAQ